MATNFTIDPAGIVRALLRGAAQVMFQNNAWCGLLFLVGIIWGACAASMPVVAWGALAGLLVATLTGWLLSDSEEEMNEGREGLWGFNGILVGCAMPALLDNTPAMWAVLVVAAAMTVWVRRGLNAVMAQWGINSLTFPFVLVVWIFLLASRTMPVLAPEHILPLQTTDAGAAAMAAAWLKGIAQVFLLDSWVAGALFLAGLAVANGWAALWAAVGSGTSIFVAWLFGASETGISAGLYGFSPTLTAIALATVFYRPGLRSAIWALAGIVVTTFMQAATDTLFEPYALSTLTAPFCIVTWLFLLPRFIFDERQRPDHTSWHKNGSEPPKQR